MLKNVKYRYPDGALFYSCFSWMFIPLNRVIGFDPSPIVVTCHGGQGLGWIPL